MPDPPRPPPTNPASRDPLPSLTLDAGQLLASLEHTLAELAIFTAQLREEVEETPDA